MTRKDGGIAFIILAFILPLLGKITAESILKLPNHYYVMGFTLTYILVLVTIYIDAKWRNPDGNKKNLAFYIFPLQSFCIGAAIGAYVSPILTMFYGCVIILGVMLSGKFIQNNAKKDEK